MTDIQAEINTQRSVYQMDRLPINGTNNTSVAVRMSGSKKLHKKKLKCSDYVRKTIPSIDWLFLNYRWSEDLMEDTMAGVAVAVLNIPQGLGYSILGNVEPTVGLYMAVFPVLVYALFGTSRHMTMGVLSVVCLMTGKVVTTYTTEGAKNDPTLGGYTAIQVATAVTLVAGLVQLLMYVFRLGLLSTVLSGTLISGFSASVAVVILTSQLKELLGVNVARRYGMMQVPYTFYDFFDRFHTINWATTTVSVITVTILLVYGKYLKERINSRLCMPLPIELIVTVFATVLFQVTTIAQDYNMDQMGEIKPGLPPFEVPPVQLFSAVFVDACVIAVVSYSLTMSLALLVSEKLKYPLDANQEMLAQGLCNVVSSFFSCLPCGASPSRSAAQKTIGGKTQMSSIVSAAIIVVVLLWIGVVFEPLPRCVLSSIIAVTLESILLKALDFPEIWRKSKTDGIVWMVTYMTVVLLDAVFGMVVGVAMSLLFVFVKGVLTDVYVLGRLPNTDLYVRLDLYTVAVEIPYVKIVRYAGSVNVINRYTFKRKLIEATRDEDGSMTDRPRSVVLDMAALQYVDEAGVKVLSESIESLMSDGYDVYLAAVPDSSLEYIRCNNDVKSVRFFPTVHDAVVYHQCRIENIQNSIHI
ncbi:prestin-like [Aphis gossypii]|uniref:prestin-like n=1 Tax=Aphis gossypii TaxID=80765 RepID=UPI002159615A|nr:prestin-like [Aphis gossypii]XP_050056314.1 prestin-like [Aphis gossypii]XP_050056315.1 prestin-like [Aphis gossypii]XP_050056316.1 prestin-like [Aphis gossypii]XP_050056317.1 prestin-like [Aphis gossypii]XP_050056318.1 prestin-like [Aphis gossypii]